MSTFDHPGNFYRNLDAHLSELRERYPRQFIGPFPNWAWPDGWHHLVAHACEVASRDYPDLCWLQIKEKFGGLRLYHSGAPRSRMAQGFDTELGNVVQTLEQESLKTCCLCSSTEAVDLHALGGWYVSLCPRCIPLAEDFNRKGRRWFQDQ